MASNKTKVLKSHLPNAPLTEVVFEMRWALEDRGKGVSTSSSDPGYPLLVDNFSVAAKKYGLNFELRMDREGIMAAHSIGYRYRKGKEQLFPIWQIGPGIFASNDSTTYEWESYKNLTLEAV